MKSEGLSASRLAEILESQPSRISHILSGRNNPSFDMLQKILRRFPQINPDWLLLDSSEIYRSGERNSSLSSALGSGDSPIDLFGDGTTQIIEPTPSASGQRVENLEGVIGENINQNFAPNFAQFERAGTTVERVIIFYSDNTFCSYNSRQK